MKQKTILSLVFVVLCVAAGIAGAKIVETDLWLGLMLLIIVLMIIIVEGAVGMEE